MNVGRSLTFVFKDPRWKGEMAYTAALLLVPLLGWLVLGGHLLGMLRAVHARRDVPLPELRAWRRPLAAGAKALVVVGTWLSAPFNFAVAPAVLDITGRPAAIARGAGGLLALVALIVLPAALARVALRGGIGAGLEARALLRMIRRAPWDYLVVLPLALVLAVAVAAAVVFIGFVTPAFLLPILSIFAFVVGPIISAIIDLLIIAYLGYVVAHLFGQAAFRGEPVG